MGRRRWTRGVSFAVSAGILAHYLADMIRAVVRSEVWRHYGRTAADPSATGVCVLGLFVTAAAAAVAFWWGYHRDEPPPRL